MATSFPVPFNGRVQRMASELLARIPTLAGRDQKEATFVLNMTADWPGLDEKGKSVICNFSKIILICSCGYLRMADGHRRHQRCRRRRNPSTTGNNEAGAASAATTTNLFNPLYFFCFYTTLCCLIFVLVLKILSYLYILCNKYLIRVPWRHGPGRPQWPWLLRPLRPCAVGRCPGFSVKFFDTFGVLVDQSNTSGVSFHPKLT